MDPSYPVAGVGYWNGGVRVRRRHLRSGREPTPAKRSGRVSSRRDPSDDQVSFVVDFSIPLPRRGGAYIVGIVGHPYLATLLPLWLTMLSYTSTTPAILAVRHASAGKGVDLTCRELKNLNGAGADLTEQELRSLNGARADPTEQELRNWNGVGADPTEQELENLNGARADPTEHELKN
ncbi:hypothetical protein BHM03_00019328 [Ensete ventricosum]|nr:hypothetical protein BHM03_00019328 [Ensete ventricosum]